MAMLRRPRIRMFPKAPLGHRLCGIDGCTNYKSGLARTCWKHEAKDEELFSRLEAEIANGNRRFEVPGVAACEEIDLSGADGS